MNMPVRRLREPLTFVFAAILGVSLLPKLALAQQSPTGLYSSETTIVSDRLSPAEPSQVTMGGLFGRRYGLSEQNRLLKISEDELLDGFRHRPGSMEWVGEHVGKWLHAASLTYAATGNKELRAKLDRVASGLIATQEADGYMGTYLPDKRFGLYAYANWDVWVHKYDLIGLLTYHQYTGDPASLTACRRIGDLMIATFGPGKKSINTAGIHDGMAATSILEPMVLLYRATQDQRYLDFAKYIVASWDAPDGAHLLTALLDGKPVYKISDGKAYEMISNLSGLCELYRVTGEKRYLTAVLNAWKDIRDNRLYITGSGSIGELWHEDNFLPNGENWSICETCATVSWVQLNMELLRLLNEPRFAEEIEKTAYNHLLAAQKPSGDDWSYYTALNGGKHYDNFFHCCHSSGPRGVALLPMFIYGGTNTGVSINMFTPSKATIDMGMNGKVSLEQITEYPYSGRVSIYVTPMGARKPFDISLRVPTWTDKVSIYVNGRRVHVDSKRSDSIIINRLWNAGDLIVYNMDMSSRVIPGGKANPNHVAVMYGPLVLSCDEALNPLMKNASVGMATEKGKVSLKVIASTGDPENALFVAKGLSYSGYSSKPEPCKLNLTPYYVAGSHGSPAFVWMQTASVLASQTRSLFLGAQETRSRAGNITGSICDENFPGFVVTFDNTRQPEDWYVLTLHRPVTVRSIIFKQGKLFHDGGWFDTSACKPRIQVMKSAESPWVDLCKIDSYPETTSTSHGTLIDDQEFKLSVDPVSIYGIRVIGVPASGDNPAQNFSSCSAIRAY